MPRIKKKSNSQEVSSFEMVAALIEQTGTITHKTVARAVNLRCPEHYLAQVDALASISGKSRNSILVHLLGAALEEVRDTLTDEKNQRVDELVATAMAGFGSSLADREQLEA